MIATTFRRVFAPPAASSLDKVPQGDGRPVVGGGMGHLDILVADDKLTGAVPSVGSIVSLPIIFGGFFVKIKSCGENSLKFHNLLPGFQNHTFTKFF